MPVPTPNDGESEQDFVSRCMGDDAMQEYDQDQRAAVCYSAFRDRSASARGKLSMTTDRLHELRRRQSEIRGQMDAWLKTEAERPLDQSATEDELTAFEGLRASLAEIDGRINRLEVMLAADANTVSLDPPPTEIARAAMPVMSAGGLRVPAQPKRTPEEGQGFKVARFLIGLAWRKWYGEEKAMTMHYNRFGDEAVSKALNISVVAEGGALIPQDFMLDLIELLRANTVIRKAGPMIVGMPLGNLTIPRLAGGASAVYQGELDDISVTEPLFDDLDLVAKKLTAMVPVSNDLLRRSPIGVETIVRDDLVQAVAHREDITFIRGDGTNKGPVGWRSLCLAANLIVPAAGGTLDVVVATLAALRMALVQGMSRMIRPVGPAPIFEFIATRRDSVGGFYFKDEIARGMLEGFPIYFTQQIPTNLGTGNGTELYLADMADVIIADTLNVMVDASDVAAYYGTDGKVVSTFQRDQSLFRVISEHDFNMRHLQSLAVATPADWNLAGLAASGGAPWSTQPLNPHWAQAPSAWPAAVTHDAAPTIYDPAVVHTSHFAGTLTANPGGGPYPLPMGMALDAGDTPPPPPPPAGGGSGGGGSPGTPPPSPPPSTGGKK
jgi:HK97 family phage major capsid protein